MEFVVTLQRDKMNKRLEPHYSIMQRNFIVKSHQELFREVMEWIIEETDTETIIDLLNIIQVF